MLSYVNTLMVDSSLRGSIIDQMIERTDTFRAYTGPKPAVYKRKGHVPYGDLPRKELEFYASQTILSGKALDLAKEVVRFKLPTDDNPHSYPAMLENALQDKLRSPKHALSSRRSLPLGFHEVDRLCRRIDVLPTSAKWLPLVALCDQLTVLQAAKPVSRLARAALIGHDPEQIQAQQSSLRISQGLVEDPHYSTELVGAHTPEISITRRSNFPVETS